MQWVADLMLSPRTLSRKTIFDYNQVAKQSVVLLLSMDGFHRGCSCEELQLDRRQSSLPLITVCSLSDW